MIEIIEDHGKLVMRVGGQEYAQYHFAPQHWKPYLYPLRAANGLSLLADGPTDHRHHHGFWVGHARVNDVDCWLERPKSGHIIHRGFADVVSGGEIGKFTEHCDWVAPSGEIVLTDTRTFIFHDTPVEARIFDFELELRAPGQAAVILHQTNEAGLPQLRVAEGLTVKSGGTLINAEGKRGERGTYKQRSSWIDCSGKLGRLNCGIALFDHPENPDHPTHWFTRDYGPISPNYGFFQNDPIVIDPQRPLCLRYRVYTHSGDATEGQVAHKWEEYREASGLAETVALPERVGR
jgi:hypothetical protein